MEKDNKEPLLPDGKAAPPARRCGCGLLRIAALLCRCSCLSSGEPPKDQDPFKYSSTEFHEMGHSRKSQHGDKTAKIIDEGLAVVLMGTCFVWKTLVVLLDMSNWWERRNDPLPTVLLANDIIEWVIVSGACLMWYTLCHWSVRAHAFWKMKVWPLPSLMPGGFMPRLAAFSLGFLMFVTSTLVTEGRVEGKSLLAKFQSDHWQSCRASAMEADGATDMWFGRLLRRPSAVKENGTAFHCFNTNLSYGHALPREFNLENLQDFFDEKNSSGISQSDALKMSVQLPYNEETGVALSQSYGFPMDDIEPWSVEMGLVNQSSFPLFGFHCMYQCVKWKSVGLMALIKNIGTIVAGSAVVVKTSDSISTAAGGRWFKFKLGSLNCPGFLWGLPLVTQDTSPDDIQSIIRSTRSAPGKGRSKFVAALVCIGACLAPLRFAPKVDNDGFYTVDYYVTAVFFSSLVMACIVRQANPYKMMMIGYTKAMWSVGKDAFIDKKSHGYRSLDLYEWIHLTQLDRANHLFQYARMITSKDIDAEFKMRKEMKKSTDDANEKITPHKHYHNKGAKLKVKMIKEVSVVTTSLPLAAELAGDNLRESSMISKLVVVRVNAVGTVVESLDGERIKVRFPRKVPENVFEYLLPHSVPLIFKIEGDKTPHWRKNKSGQIVPITVPWDPSKKESCTLHHECCPAHHEMVDKSLAKLPKEEKEDILAKFKASNTKKEAMYQYTMDLTPKPNTPEKKRKVNAWFHNSLLHLLAPPPHHEDDEESQEEKEYLKQKKHEDGDLADAQWEDVVVSLHEVIEVSDQWLQIESERDLWMKSHASQEAKAGEKKNGAAPQEI